MVDKSVLAFVLVYQKLEIKLFCKDAQFTERREYDETLQFMSQAVQCSPGKSELRLLQKPVGDHSSQSSASYVGGTDSVRNIGLGDRILFRLQSGLCILSESDHCGRENRHGDQQ